MNQSLYESYQKLAEGTTINSVTLLSTDYLNHFNEAVMLLELVPDMPDMLDDVKDWQPKTYADHFHDSQFKQRDLAIEAYDVSPPDFRQPFDAVVRKLNDMIAEAIITVAEAVSLGDEDRLRLTVADITDALRAEIDHAGAIINGSAERIDQDAVDAIFDDVPAEEALPGPQEFAPVPDQMACSGKNGNVLAFDQLEIEVPFDVAIAFSREMAHVLCGSISTSQDRFHDGRM